MRQPAMPVSVKPFEHCFDCMSAAGIRSRAGAVFLALVLVVPWLQGCGGGVRVIRESPDSGVALYVYKGDGHLRSSNRPDAFAEIREFCRGPYRGDQGRQHGGPAARDRDHDRRGRGGDRALVGHPVSLRGVTAGGGRVAGVRRSVCGGRGGLFQVSGQVVTCPCVGGGGLRSSMVRRLMRDMPAASTVCLPDCS